MIGARIDRARTLAICAFAVLVGAACAQASAAERVSKLEARQIRHSCGLRASEHSLRDKEWESFVAQCYARRAARIDEARACRVEREKAGIDEQHRREFMRACVRAKAAHK